MKKKTYCKCGSACFQTINVTPAGCAEAMYFVRCRKCGLVSFSNTRVSSAGPVLRSIKAAFRYTARLAQIMK